MSEIDVGARAQNIDIGAEGLNITKVNLVVDSDHMFTAGNGTGRTMEVACPWGTQAMADRILATMSAVQYRPYTAERAMVDPAFEPGDAVSVGGVYSQIISADFTYNRAGLVTIGAPDLDEIDDEYPGGQTRNSSIKRQLAFTRSLISKANDRIAMELYGEDGKGGLNGRMNTFTMSLSGIATQIQGYKETVDGYEEQLAEYKQELTGYSGAVSSYKKEVDGFSEKVISYEGDVDGFRQQVARYTEQAGKYTEEYSTISQKVDNIKLEVTNDNGTVSIELKSGDDSLGSGSINLTGMVTFSALSSAPGTGETKINGGWIDAETLNVKAANVSGSLRAGALNLDGVLPLTRDTYTYGYMGVNLGMGGPVICDSTYNVFFVTTGNAAKMSYYEQKKIWVASGGCYSNETMQVYSDQRMKTALSYELEDEEKLFASLRPCSFQMIGDTTARKHWGFIAQDVIATAGEVGMETGKLAAIGSYENMNTLAYSEFIALNTHMIQKLMARVAELEAKIA